MLPSWRQIPHLWPGTCEKAPVQDWVIQVPGWSFRSHRACDGGCVTLAGRSLIKDFWLSLPGLMLDAGWNKTKSIQCTTLHYAPLKTLLGNQIFQSCWWAMHLVSALETKEPISCDLLFYSSKKFLEECSAGLFDVTELFSLTLCVEAMHNLSAGRILGCPFVFRLI